jgi:AIPR protein
MMREIPIEITHLPGKLRTDFTGRLPEAASGTPEAREANFLSRALAAYAAHKLARCTLDEAAAAVVDGGGDGGIDAVYYSTETSILWVIQSKYISDGRGEPSLGDATKFKAGLENLLQGNFEAFRANAALTAMIPQLEGIFRDTALLQVRVILVYSGIDLVSEDRRRLFEDLKRRFSSESEYLQIQFCNLTTIYDWITGADQGLGVPEVALRLRNPGWIKRPYETVYGIISLEELANLQREHGKRLIVSNIRGYKGDTDVNDQILATIRQEPEHFFYLNNGLTAYCARLEVNNLDRANQEEKRIRAFGFSIVNGAQTLGSVTEFFRKPPDAAPDGYVFLKVISLERCEYDNEFAERITRSTNYQNQIGLRDFVALDEQQERIAKQLMLSGITYHYKDDADTPTPDDANFTLKEATTASACLAQQPDCDFCARILANQRSLWSFEAIYSEAEINRSRYSKVFLPDRSARTVWRAVQAQRVVRESMLNSARASIGIRKAFFENSRWLVLNVLFLRLRPEQGNELSLTPEETSAIAALTIELAESLWGICIEQGFVSRRAEAIGEPYEQTRHFRSVFSTASDCARLRNALLAKLNSPRAVAPTEGDSGTPSSPATI